MANSTVIANAAKRPQKPYPDFPLTIHPSGRFCKKIRGRVYYFGSWADGWQSALEKYNREKDYLYSGVKPPATDGLTIKDACNEFLTAKRRQVDAGELSPRSWADYRDTAQRVSDVLGSNRMVENLTPDDFAKLRADFAKGKGGRARGPVRIAGEIQRTRTMFKYCFDMGWIATPVRFGPEFRKPSKKAIRKQRQSKGMRAFTPDEIRKLLAHAPQPMRSMIWLAINAGLGQSDLATLPHDAVDLERGWINFPRPKTGAERRCPLWPSTRLALREWLAKCPTAREPADAGLMFITRCHSRWCKTNPLTGASDDAISKEFDKLLKRLGMKRAGLAFYALRRSFRTIADETLDQPATRLIMGHTDSGIEDHYREHIADSRLERIANYVFDSIFPPPSIPADA